MARNPTIMFAAVIGAIALTIGGTAGAQSAQDDPALTAAGMVVFEANCSGCHGLDGMGSDSGRPLTGIADQEPNRLVHVASVTEGKGFMPAFGERLTGDEIDAAIAYVRLTFVDTEAPELAVTGPTRTVRLGVAALLAVALGWAMVGTSRRRPA